MLSNDTDPEHDALTAILVTGVSHGSLTLNSNGSLSYTPAAGASSSPTTVATLRTWTSFINSDSTSAEIAPVERLNGGVRLGAIRHFDEAEAAQTSAKLIADQVDFAN